MEMRFTKTFDRLRANWDNRYLIFRGGSSSSKSISILQMLTLYALKYKNKRVTLSAESLPVIKKTIFADWKQIVMQDLFDEGLFNKSEMLYTFPTGTVFNFIPADSSERWHGLRQHIVYFDELYNIHKDIYQQADVRTSERVISSFNPTAMFYIADSFNDDKTYVDLSTYHDNQYLEQSIIDALEKRIKTDPNFYRTYVLGEWGSNEGLIFKEGTNWTTTKEWPEDYKWRVFGLDFGFSIDPTALTEIRYSNGELYTRQHIYSTGLTNPMIIEQIPSDILHETIVADSAEPKSIQYLNDEGLDIEPAVKGPDSIRFGIDNMKQFKINIHYESLDLIKEFRNYKWKQSRQGEKLSVPVDSYNHGIDSARYALASKTNLLTIDENYIS